MSRTFTNSDNNVRYVLSGQPTGWPAMATEVRNFDEERVKDTKEDIDTLLVFAGLFSAVLTAFLVESYQRLLPDTASQMLATSSQTLAVMQQVSLQLSNGTYQPLPITPVATSEPFQPSSADIRVNILWFASLIFSLMTASFGMLVKQWLREFLATENPSPQARLRIRHYRYPGLQQWKVFEIAAILPLLQQLALALFFIGLCYFTASVHASVGYTSLPLVSGWAFCVALVTFLPTIFPRCPYKTALVRALHVRIAYILESSAHLSYSSRILRYLRDNYHLQWLWRCRASIAHHLWKHNERSVVKRDEADLDILADVDALQSNDELLGTSIFDALQQIRDPSWDSLMGFVHRVLWNRLQSTNLVLSSQPQPLSLIALSRSAYIGIIDILSYASGLHIISPDQPGFRWQNYRATMAALYIFFSPSRYPLPRSGIKVLSRILRSHGAGTIRKLTLNCLKSEDPKVQLHMLLVGIQQRARDMDWDFTLYLQCLESLVDAVFHDARARLGISTLHNNFSFQRDVTAWPWDDDRVWNSGRVCYYISLLAEDVIHRAIHPRTLNTNDTGLHARIESDSREFTGVLFGLLYFVATASNKSWATARQLRSVVRDCASQEASTLSLFKALDQVPITIVTRICLELEDLRSNDISLDPDLLQRFIDCVDKLSPDQSTQDPATLPVTMILTLKITSLAIHMVKPRNTPQDREAWKTLSKALSRLIHRTTTPLASSTCDCAIPTHESQPPTIDAPTDTSVFDLYRCIRSPHDLSLIGLMDLAEACLNGIQQLDIAVLDQDDTPKPLTYTEWLPLYSEENTIFEDDFVIMLGVIYIASQDSIQPASDFQDPEDKDVRFWRLRRLGVVQEIRSAFPLPDGGRT